MSWLLICTTALAASGLTLFSGFGLGTLLLPAFALFFPLPAAVAMTAVVHLANNLFKLGLVGARADRGLVLRFGLPALVCAAPGALLLKALTGLPPLAEYRLGGHLCRVRPDGVAVAALMVVFAVIEILPRFQRASIDPRWLPLGGALSGFAGGVSGHQGALRAAFLLRFKRTLTPESFIATNVVTAVMVDVARLSVYGATFSWEDTAGNLPLVAAATFSAFAGAWLGARLVKKITMRAVQRMVAVMLVVLAAAIGSGVIGNR